MRERYRAFIVFSTASTVLKAMRGRWLDRPRQ